MFKFQENNNFLKDSDFFYTIAIGMDSTYSYVSKSYDKNFDHINDSLLGKNFSITLHPEDINSCAEVAAKCFDFPDQLFPITLRKIDGKGDYVFTQWEMQAMFDEENKPIGIFCVGYNISEHIATSKQLNDANTELASKVDKLREIGLLQSHTVRRPLANIIGLAGILNTMTLDTNLLNIKNMIVESAEQLDGVIKDIVNLTHNDKSIIKKS